MSKFLCSYVYHMTLLERTLSTFCYYFTLSIKYWWNTYFDKGAKILINKVAINIPIKVTPIFYIVESDSEKISKE